MRFSKTVFSLAAAALILSTPAAFAQSAGAAASGTAANGMSAQTPSTTTGRSDSMHDGKMNATSSVGGTDAGAGSTKSTATGGPAGGNATRN